MKRKLIGVVAAMLSVPSLAMAWMPGDSIGTRVIEGKAYVLLRVTKGDNLSAIARTYSASVPYLQELNKLPSPSINVGQVLLVPSRGNGSGMSLAGTPKPAPAPSPAPAPTPAPSPKPTPPAPAAKPSEGASATGLAQTPSPKSDPQKHKVESGESLFAVARKYGVGVDQIKKWNNLSTDGLRVGQVLIVSDPGTKPSTTVAAGNTPPAADSTQKLQPVAQDKPGVHVVKQGETLYGIARQYGMDARDLKVINKIEDPNLKVGQVLKVHAEQAANPNQGTNLIDMIATSPTDTATVKEAFPDLKVLTASPTTLIAPAAKVTPYRDKATGKNYKRVEEEGTVGLIEDYVTDQTKFYAFHRHLPVGSYIRIDFPDKGQSILAEVTSQLPARDPYLVRLSAKCLDYLMVRQPGANVRIRYVVPAAD